MSAAAAGGDATAADAVQRSLSPQPIFAVAGANQHTVAAPDTASTNAAVVNAASVVAAASTMTIASPNTTAAILLDSARTGLATFNASSDVQAFLKNSVQAYIDARAAHSKAATALSRFETTCSRTLGPAGLQLPKSMQLQLVKSARFDNVPDNPHFNRDAIEQLQRVEQETSKQIFTIMLGAKKKLVAHLHEKANAHRFVNLQTIAFENAILNDYAKNYDDNFASAENQSSFPHQEASRAFTSELLKRVSACFTEEQEARRQAEKQKEAREAEERRAQEQIVAGVHTGANIRSIAEKAALKAVDSVNKKTANLGQHPLLKSAAPTSANASFTSNVPNKEKPTTHTPRLSWAGPPIQPSSNSRHAAASLLHKRGRNAPSRSRSRSRDRVRHEQSTTSHGGQINRHDYTVHKGNNRRESTQSTTNRSSDTHSNQHFHNNNSLPKNGHGGDRQPNSVHPPSQHNESRRTSFQHRESERERNSQGHTQYRHNRH